MSPDINDISARLLAIETVVGHLLTHMAVRDDDPSGWLATRRTLALRAADRVGGTNETEELAIAVREAVAAFFDGADYAVRSPRPSVARQ
ncbi:MAG: hypothetical protein ABI224_05280 [Acetobacteraceae bacterium]